MEILYNALISIASALIGGVFSFVCILITIKHENKHFKEERLEREKERAEQKCDKNKDKNENIIKNRPQFIIVDDSEQADEALTVKLLPQAYYTINTLLTESMKEMLTFDYPSAVYEIDYWDNYSVTIKNVGGLSKGGFLHLPDKSWVNIYDESYFDEESYVLANFYSEMISVPTIKNGETLKIKIYYPKAMLIYKSIKFDLFMYDQYENHWRQDDVIHEHSFNDSYPVCSDEYDMNYREELIQWQVLRRLYDHNLNSKIKMDFDDVFARNLFDLKNKECADKELEFERYRRDVKDGKVLLKS